MQRLITTLDKLPVLLLYLIELTALVCLIICLVSFANAPGILTAAGIVLNACTAYFADYMQEKLSTNPAENETKQ